MITLQNYFEKKDQIDWSKISEVTKANIKDIELLMQTAIDVPESLDVKEIETEITIFLAEINKAAKQKTTRKKSSTASTSKKEKRPVKNKQASKGTIQEEKQDERLSTYEQIRLTTYFKKLVPYNQKKALVQMDNSEFDKIITKVEKQLEEIPKKSQGESIEKSSVHAHYYHGNTDWYIVDIVEENNLLFGYIILNGNTQDAEAGYFSIDELTEERNARIGFIELDFHFKKDTLENILYKRYPKAYPKPTTNNTKSAGKAPAKKSKPNSKAIQKVVDIKTVDHFSTEYRLIRRFYNLIRLHKTTTFRKIQLLYTAFQKAPLERSIRKTSADADLFTKINKKVVALFKAVNPTKSDANIDFTDKKLLEQMQNYVKGHKVNYAITLLKSFVSLQGLKPDTEKVERLLNRIENAIEKGRVTKDNRLFHQILIAKSELIDYLEKPTTKIEPTQIGLSLPARSLCTNRIKCAGLRKDGKLNKGYRFVDGGNVARVKKKVV
ncbi:hypothetical protein KORDIASMS9_00392 [Kordia sp. SMS9]|uniref:hypothetical protein n=1 Tax=Kordia sp. SMS9 TaxID=2282170 RepID=UPI000E0CF933|nr:hypothetical protein [Kordia sp. SMS9]AXG68202.1 hypothetical protein KORDIASMS9_00392 [Kordia sp. SMS9]